jgi:hypothetical protein
MTTYQRNTLQNQGFEVSGNRVSYMQCEAVVINGVACHEHGCPNQTHECHGCNAIVARGVRYCEECC